MIFSELEIGQAFTTIVDGAVAVWRKDSEETAFSYASAVPGIKLGPLLVITPIEFPVKNDPLGPKFFAHGVIEVQANGAGRAAIPKPKPFRNSPFDETFTVRLLYTGIAAGKKLKFTIEEIN